MPRYHNNDLGRLYVFLMIVTTFISISIGWQALLPGIVIAVFLIYVFNKK